MQVCQKMKKTIKKSRGELPPSKRKLKEKEDWDLEYFLYLYTVVLNRTEKEFWSTSPKKLFMMISQHIKYNNVSSSDKKKETVYLNQGTQIGKN